MDRPTVENPNAGVHATFELHPILQGVESKQAGREIYKDVPHCRIRVAGQPKSEFVGPVTDELKVRFPREWDAFQRGVEAPTHGTPLSVWGRITPSLLRTLNALGIKTVEDMASVADLALGEIPGGFKLRDEARKFLSLSQSAADVTRLEELEAKHAEDKATIQAQGQKLAELQEQMAEFLRASAEKEPKKKRKETDPE